MGHYWTGVAVQGVLYQSTLNVTLTESKTLGRKRCTSNRDDRELESTVKQSRFKHLGELYKEWTEAGVSASRVTTLRHLQERATQPLLKQKHHQKHLTWAKEKKNWTVAQWSNDHFMLPSADKLYGYADFISQQEVVPAHTAKGTKSCFNDHGVAVLDWPANSPDQNPIENLCSIVKRKMRHQTQQCRWPEGRCQTNLGFHYTWAVPQADCLHATQHWCSNSCKKRFKKWIYFSEAWRFCLKYICCIALM